MAKKWYPVVDILSCVECGTCVDFCAHVVYDRTKAPSPVVINPVGCVDHCHGCGNRCPAGAITYVGDDTGWIPPAARDKAAAPGAASGCGCGCDGLRPAASDDRKLLIEYLYLDLHTCERCIGTDAVLDEVVAALRPALELAGYAVDYRKREMATPELAEQYRFLSSPTIRVNGRDIFGTVQESSCNCCGEIAGADVNCSVFEYEGGLYEVPSREMLANAILLSLSAQPECGCGAYELPQNLRRFYAGKARRNGAASHCNCNG